MDIQEVSPEFAKSVDEHLLRHIAESGRHGIHWLPFEPLKLINPPTVSVEGLDLAEDIVGWQRWYAVLDVDRRVVGHLSLKGSRFDRALHRTELGMGLEHPYRGLGLGSELVALAINKAKNMASVNWLDLHVLSCNEPGIGLYLKFGFQEVSRVPDFCRIDGEPMDDVFMSLDVTAESHPSDS